MRLLLKTLFLDPVCHPQVPDSLIRELPDPFRHSSDPTRPLARQNIRATSLRSGNYSSGEQAERPVGIAASYAIGFQPVCLLPDFQHGLGVCTEFFINLNFKGFLKFAYPGPTGALFNSRVIGRWRDFLYDGTVSSFS
jgi:hypothetical protein